MVMGTWAEASVGEDLAEVWWSVEVDSGFFKFFFRKLWVVGSEERM